MATRIILIETATALLSTAIVEDGKIICSLECEEPRSQASLTAPFIKEMLDKTSFTVKDCSAVCVSMGPGSYTGLRVGVSTAKGLCFGSGIPLIGISTLDILAAMAGAKEGVVVPMVDARRMEVYSAVYSAEGERKTDIGAMIVGPDSFAGYLAAGPVVFIGDGAAKCKDVITSPSATFIQTCPKASAMAPLAMAAYEKKQFEDIAYFEPFYLKDFVATVSRKNLF